jgi:myo-inositol-1(or 4)-monophosphatase
MTLRFTTQAERVELANIAQLVAAEAGELVAAGYRSRPRADEKARSDLVTEYDRASEALIVTRLATLSSIPVIGEESSAGEAPRSGLVWFVDPLDGTTNFVHGHPFWCVAIGLMQDDEPVVGAVVAPAIGVRWLGFIDPVRDELGALRGEVRRNGQPCRVSSVSELRSAMIATGFPPERHVAPANNFDSFMSVKRAAQAVRRCGSAAIDLCMVADGTYDGYWERRLFAWDAVAAGAMVLGAGGRITALGGERPDYHRGHIVASNGLLHDALRAAISGK